MVYFALFSVYMWVACGVLSMETEVGVGGNDEAKLDDMPAVEAGSAPSLAREMADPVVYKLVRVYSC